MPLASRETPAAENAVLVFGIAITAGMLVRPYYPASNPRCSPIHCAKLLRRSVAALCFEYRSGVIHEHGRDLLVGDATTLQCGDHVNEFFEVVQVRGVAAGADDDATK